MEENTIQQKSYCFAVRMVNLYRHLTDRKQEFVLAKQLLRSGTSIGANVEEALAAQSRNDFTAKLSIARKEARETRYWLRLLHDTSYLSDKEAQSVLSDVEELLKLLTSIILSVQRHPKPGS